MLVTRCRAADIRVHTLRQHRDHDLAPALHTLLDTLEACTHAHHSGHLDPGTLAELTYAANVEINVIARTNATDPALALPNPGDLTTRLHQSWEHFLRLLELSPATLHAEEPALAQQAGYHLSAYASFLAGQPDPAHLTHAAHLFTTSVLPARHARYQRTTRFEPLRQALQTATRATTTLATHAHQHGDHTTARHWATLGRDWITTALHHPHTRTLLDTGGEAACHLALLATPALLTALRCHASPDPAADLDTARDLLRVARDYATSLPGPYTRHSEIDTLDTQLHQLAKDVCVMPLHDQHQDPVAGRRG